MHFTPQHRIFSSECYGSCHFGRYRQKESPGYIWHWRRQTLQNNWLVREENLARVELESYCHRRNITKLTSQALALPVLIRSDKRVMLPNIFNLRPNQLEKVVSHTQERRVCFTITLQRRVPGKWNELVGSEVENIFVRFLSFFLPLLLFFFHFRDPFRETRFQLVWLS